MFCLGLTLVPLTKLPKLRFGMPWLAALGLAGCTTYPMGFNKAQWEALPPAQQAEFRAKQYLIDEESTRNHAAEQARRVQAQREADERERAHIAEAYRLARYGDIVTVTVRDGSVTFYGKRHPYEPIAFDLVRGETKPIVFRRYGQPHITTGILMHLAEDGNTFYFDYPSRNRFVAVNDGWQRGREYLRLEAGGQNGHPASEGIRITIKHRLLPADIGPP